MRNYGGSAECLNVGASGYFALVLRYTAAPYSAQRRAGTRRQRQLLQHQRLVLQYDEALDQLFQLPNVPWPLIRQQALADNV